MFLKIVYTLFIGVLLATLVGVGIAAFYIQPKMPDYPSVLKVAQPQQVDKKTSEDLLKEQEKYDAISRSFQEKLQHYNQNVSIAALCFALITLIISLTLFKKILVIADGLLLGGVLTLVYSIIRGFDTGDDRFRFVVVAIGFVIAVSLGYIKFIQQPQDITSSH